MRGVNVVGSLLSLVPCLLHSGAPHTSYSTAIACTAIQLQVFAEPTLYLSLPSTAYTVVAVVNL